jgi:hypothetical protein
MSSPVSYNPSQPSTADATVAYLRDLMAKRFWGNITIKMQGGSPIHLTKEESIPADKLSATPNNRSTHDPQR